MIMKSISLIFEPETSSGLNTNEVIVSVIQNYNASCYT